MQKMSQIREREIVIAFCANLNRKALSLFGYFTRSNAASALFTLTGRISRIYVSYDQRSMLTVNNHHYNLQSTVAHTLSLQLWCAYYS